MRNILKKIMKKEGKMTNRITGQNAFIPKNIGIIRMFPSDPTGSLDDFILSRYFNLGDKFQYGRISLKVH
mgnify:CR=1 FL=1